MPVPKIILPIHNTDTICSPWPSHATLAIIFSLVRQHLLILMPVPQTSNPPLDTVLEPMALRPRSTDAPRSARISLRDLELGISAVVARDLHRITAVKLPFTRALVVVAHQVCAVLELDVAVAVAGVVDIVCAESAVERKGRLPFSFEVCRVVVLSGC